MSILTFSILLQAQLGCASWRGVTPFDGRLAHDSRLQLADAEDEVTIALGRRAAGVSDLRELERDLDELAERVAHTDESGALLPAFETYVDARLTAEEHLVRGLELELDLAHARLQLLRGRVAARHGLARPPLARLERRTRALHEQRAALRADTGSATASDRAADAFWSAYADHVGGGGGSAELWNFALEESR